MKLQKKPNGYWTLKRCKEDALKYDTKNSWCQNSFGYKAAYKNGWLEECCTHMDIVRRPNGYWNIDRCKNDALKYRTKTEWRNSNSGAYAIAKKNKWMSQCCQHMIKPPVKRIWTLDACKEEALKYKTRSEWQRTSVSSYTIAHKQGWLEECCGHHMKRSNGTSQPEVTILDMLKTQFPKVQSLRVKTKDYFQNKPHIQGFDIDIYIPELRKGIEFNGDYWHSDRGLKRSREHWPQEDIDNYHQLKRQFFTAKNIDYIEIWEKDWILDRQSCIKKCLEFLQEK